MALRKLHVDQLSLTADTEASWDIPAGTKFMEANKRTDNETAKIDAELRIAFEENGTDDSGDYRSTYTDWWTPEDNLELIENDKVYFRCSETLVLEIVYGIQ